MRLVTRSACAVALAFVALALLAGCASPAAPSPVAPTPSRAVDGGAPRAFAAPAKLTAGFDFTCSNYVCTFTDTSHGPAAIVAWSWDFSDGTFSTEQNPVHPYPPNQNTNFRVKLTVTDAAGVTDSVRHMVQVHRHGHQVQ